MTDTMLFGVLKMPFEMAMKDEISRIQFYGRVQELVGRFEAQQQAEPVAWPMEEQPDGAVIPVDPADMAPPKQQAEPVAYLCENAVGHKYLRWKKPSSTYKPIALYTTPPQRPWVGLTVTTILNMMPSTIPAEYDGPLMEFARAVEAKLKERNGY